jgi:UDP-N-acetylglucosamine 2-epimerase (non-hydrolysing)
MRVLTVLGTRPEIIRLSSIIGKLDAVCEHVLVHTDQNYDTTLNEIFFEQLNVRHPDHHLHARGSFAEQTATILTGMEKLLLQIRPDRFLVHGDTNSSLAAIVAKRLAIPVYHMEAGNRCYDDRVPEEVNRRIIDHSSDILIPYTERSRMNLLREGIPGQRIFVTGNPAYEVLTHYNPQIEASEVVAQLGLSPRHYFLVTTHRAENVDIEERLRGITSALDRLQRDYNMPVVVSTHPRTRARMDAFRLEASNPRVHFLPPFGFFDFVSLQRNAFCVLTDSGVTQEECCIAGVPTVTIRDATERPETLEFGSNMLAGTQADSILRAVTVVTSRERGWRIPVEYQQENVSDTIVKLLLAYRLASP